MAEPFDLLIAGAGINGAGIARDAALRGLRVAICDEGDIAGATSSASTKLIHGGLRYLEHGAFSLVREALREREVLLRIAPHLVREQRFVIPHTAALRPAWMIALGLFLYDHLGGHSSLAPSCSIRLGESPFGEALRPGFTRAFGYSDLAVDDARLTLLNVRAAADAGARVLPYTRLVSATRSGGHWEATLVTADGDRIGHRARILVNATGAWVATVRNRILGRHTGARVRLVQGSHVVLPRLYAGSHAYLFQNADRRIVFAIPYQGEHTLIGTTEVVLDDPQVPVAASDEEVEYLCRAAGAFLRAPVRPADVQWRFAGVRALYDDGHADPSAVSREYRLQLDGTAGEPPMLSVFGGKLTTYRRLAERALAKLSPWLPGLAASRTAELPLPGGEPAGGAIDAQVRTLVARHPALPASWLEALVRRHGSRAAEVIGEAGSHDVPGRHFGANLHEAEVQYLVRREWARRSDDVLWRRTKCGLDLSADERDAFGEAFAAIRERFAGGGSA